jgi:predicted NBD/HSP70 family sugar kinase
VSPPRRTPAKRAPTKLQGFAQPTAGEFRGANIVHAGDHNRRTILQAIRAIDGITRPELVKLTGLTMPTVSAIANQFLEEGLIFKSGRRNGERGQPASHFSIHADGAFSLGLNIDRDHLTLLAMDFAGEVRARVSREIAFPLPTDTSTFLKQALDEILKSKAIPQRRLIGFGIAIPDALGETRLPNQPAAFKSWSTLKLDDFIRKKIDIPVFCENDAAAAAMGELYFGAGLHANSFFYVLISAGLGGGLVINRQYCRGAHGRSGEIGFLPLSHRPNKRGDGRQSLGDAVLMRDLLAMLKQAGISISAPEQLGRLDGAAKTILRKWTADVAQHLYDPILTLVCGIDPDAVFIGGRLPAPVVDMLCDELNRRLSKATDLTWPHALVRRAALAEDASAMGAAILPFMDRHLPIAPPLTRMG